MTWHRTGLSSCKVTALAVREAEITFLEWLPDALRGIAVSTEGTFQFAAGGADGCITQGDEEGENVAAPVVSK